jgi:polar amino acid transport system permease protein
VDHEQGARPTDPAVAAAGSRRSRILGGPEGTRSVVVALASTVVFFAIVSVLVVTSPGWDEVRRAFFDGAIFTDAFPGIADAFLLNIRIFVIAEAIILVFALFIAVLRSLPGRSSSRSARSRSHTPISSAGSRPSSSSTSSASRAGAAALRRADLAALLGCRRARARLLGLRGGGVPSGHRIRPPEPGGGGAFARGLTRGQTLRSVILPQAVRRVLPPLLNDFIGLQKDSALLALIGPVEAFRQAQIKEAATFNFTPYLATALLFVLLTIPLARLTDWLIARDRRRQLAGRTA